MIRREWIGLGGSSATLTVENQLGIAGNPIYFFAMRSERAFGLVVFALRLRQWPERKDKGATPFDSGGLWHRKVRTLHPLSNEQVRQVFANHDIALNMFRKEFDAYLHRNYSEVNDYVVGKPPSCGTVPIVPKKPNSSRAWTWEVRVPQAVMNDWTELVCGFITPKALSDYKRWLDYDSGIEDPEARSIHLWLNGNMKLAPEGVAAYEFAQESLMTGEVQ